MSNTQDLKTFYQTLLGTDPLKDDHDSRYVSILQANPNGDPINQLKQRIDWAVSESVHLLTGFRGNGKTTELNRLKRLLEVGGCHVIRIDMDDYLNTTQPVEIGDFLLSIMAALTYHLEQENDLKAVAENCWDRLYGFLKTEVALEGIEIDVASIKLGLKMKNDPSFKRQVQQKLRGHVASLVMQTQEFATKVVNALRAKCDDENLKVVLLVDSVEHIRGIGTDAQAVYASVLNTFSAHGDKLALPTLHVVYTVPPFLVLHANCATRSMGGNPIVMWPNVHVVNKQGNQDKDGLNVMRAIVSQRFAAWEAIIPPNLLDDLAVCTGGDLRDFFRQVREVLVRLGISGNTTADADIVARVNDELRNSLRLMLTEQDRRKLDVIHDSKELQAGTPDDLPVLNALLDSNLIMNYQNGAPWFDIHPLLRKSSTTAD